MLRFLLNQTLVEEPDLPPDLTVLDYLREHRRLTGTKEGCASGDCGACTVVIASEVNGSLQYKSINSCIALVGDLHGRQLITVEHLADGDKLHMVQQSMVDYHGSQCGFCTPGFVMSLFALSKERAVQEESRRSLIMSYLGGNLCRCTGYRPIIDAANSMLDQTAVQQDQFDQCETQTIELLQSINSQQSSSGFLRPESLNQLFELKAQFPAAPVVSGCTDFGLEITQRLQSFETIISTTSVAELNTISLQEGVWRIGAGCTIGHLLTTLGPLHNDIRELLQRYGSTQVRNAATVGGNLGNASPIGDLPPLLIALNARVVLKSSGAERVLPLAQFFIDYKKTQLAQNEIISAVLFDEQRLQGDGEFRIYKVSKRIDDDISTVCAAFHWQPSNTDGGRLTAAFGGMAAIPKRAATLESAAKDILAGTFDPVDAALALEKDFTPIGDARASAAYRIEVAKNLFVRFVLECRAGEADQPLKLSDVAHG